MKYQGLYTAIVTPFKNGVVDYDAYKALIEAQIAGGVDGIVPMGTTGESPTVSTEEHLEIIRKCVEFVAGRCQVIAGTGANSTAEAIEMTKAAAAMGILDLVKQAGATLEGMGFLIEKAFQNGGNELRNMGIHVESLAIIDSLDNCTITLRN